MATSTTGQERPRALDWCSPDSPVSGSPVPRTGRLGSSIRRAWLPLLLLGVSILTISASGSGFMQDFRHGLLPLSSEIDLFPLPLIWRHPAALLQGWSFTLTLLSILLAHEMGHVAYCRKHGIKASWPYVLPAPTISGTAGAVIRIQSRIPSRAALIEVGIAGPIAGYAVALPAAILGLLLSRRESRAASAAAVLHFHQPVTIALLHKGLCAIVPGFPRHILPHPVLLAAWIGFFVTSLNLIPAGQLDGGHILYAISPKAHRATRFVAPAVLLVMGLLFWAGWLLWGAILLLPMMRHPFIPASPSLSGRQRLLGWIAILLLILCMLPAPFAGTGLLDFFR
ncbi:MAG TPA: site-2 protease family protein [Acidobacteriaceae bacterium]|nr:site-2 protease family protein [Acidobacteriaceae bacterium]